MQTKKEFFDYEKECQKLFDKFYLSKGWKCKRIAGLDNKFYDCILLVHDKFYKIEEKCRSKDYGDFLVEIEQDTETHSQGWLYYTHADYIFYMVEQRIIYSIDMIKLCFHLQKFQSAYNKKISKKGWGNTVNIVIPWNVILKNGIGKRIL